MIRLDERLKAAAAFVLQETKGMLCPRVADVGCDHGYLSAYLLEQHPALSVLACDVSAPSLDKARGLMAGAKYAGRVRFAVADGLAALEEPVDAIVIAGMGGETILGILEAGRMKIGAASLILQANTDLPMLRSGLARMGFAVVQEAFAQAAGRRYVTMLARQAQQKELTAREALLGSAHTGAREESQRAYFAWQRDVRVREMQRAAGAAGTVGAAARMEKNSTELNWIAEAMGMNTCKVSDIVQLVGQAAPYELAEPWDNVGLLAGRSSAEAERVLVALDLTPEVIREAKTLGAQVIVTHHPIMFSARKRVTDEDYEGGLLLEMIENGMAHIAAHTNLDAAPGGVNDTLMAALGARNVCGEGVVRVGEMDEGTTLGQLAECARRKLHAAVRVFGHADTVVHKLGCCSGAGSDEYKEAAALGADCFITGEVKHHIALEAAAQGVCMLEAGHYETENPVCEVLADTLQKAADAVQYKLTVFSSRVQPFGR